MEKQENYMQRVGPHRCNQCAFQTEDGNELTRHFLEFHSGLMPSAERPASEPERVSDAELVKEMAGSFFITGGRQYRFNRSDVDALKSSLKPFARELRTLRAQLADRDNHIATAYAALDDILGCGCKVNRNVYLFDHIRKLKEQLAEKDAGIEQARSDALEKAAKMCDEFASSSDDELDDWEKREMVEELAFRIRALAAQKKEG